MVRNLKINPYLIKYPWTFWDGWLNQDEAKAWKMILLEKVLWEEMTITVYGKKHLTPRLSAFLGEEGISYRYSGVVHRANGFPTWFLPLLNKVNTSSQIIFNGCLLHLYRDGIDCMGWHADDEKEIDPNSPISSLSLGAKRDFIFKNRRSLQKEILNLDNGDLLLMHPNCQKDWLHSLPVRKRINKPRINLTFRKFIA